MYIFDRKGARESLILTLRTAFGPQFIASRSRKALNKNFTLKYHKKNFYIFFIQNILRLKANFIITDKNKFYLFFFK